MAEDIPLLEHLVELSVHMFDLFGLGEFAVAKLVEEEADVPYFSEDLLASFEVEGEWVLE